MRIKKKTPKPSAKRPPLYFIGFRGATPEPGELALWYNREYGGPLTMTRDPGAPESWQASHGPWSAHVVIPLPATHAAGLKEQLAWEQELIGAVAPSVAPPRDMPDAVLFSARLARGLTLLTQGTAYDVTTGSYVNPSDWLDRPLTTFSVGDHVAILVTEAGDGRQWLYSLGLRKFGLDELEFFCPLGLPTGESTERLTLTADELTRLGQVPKVGSVFGVAGFSARVLKHRTASPGGTQIILREVQFESETDG